MDQYEKLQYVNRGAFDAMLRLAREILYDLYVTDGHAAVVRERVSALVGRLQALADDGAGFGANG